MGATKAAGSDALVEAVVNSLYLQQACRMVWLCSVGGCACLWSVFLIDSKALFLLVVCFGCICVFFTTPGINLAIMKAVGPRHRSFAIAMCNLLIHALGDVPSPVITGLLKDKVRLDWLADCLRLAGLRRLPSFANPYPLYFPPPSH